MNTRVNSVLSVTNCHTHILHLREQRWSSGICKSSLWVRHHQLPFFFVTCSIWPSVSKEPSQSNTLNMCLHMRSLCEDFSDITLLNHCLCQSLCRLIAEGYPCAWHCRGNERTLRHFPWSLMCWRQDAEAYYSIPGISVDLCSQMCSLAIIAGVIYVAVIPQVPRPNNRRAASASLNCSELINPGRCSRFRHLLSEGRDYGSTYGSSYVILYRCCAKNSSEMSVCFLITFTCVHYSLTLNPVDTVKYRTSIYSGPFQ